MSRTVFLIVLIQVFVGNVFGQERGKPIPCDMVITKLDSHDVYNPNNPKFLFSQIEISQLSDWKSLDTLMLRTITELNVSREMFLVSGTIPAIDLPRNEQYEWTIAKAAVYFHTDGNTEFGINPDFHQYLIAKKTNEGIALRNAGFQDGKADWSYRKTGRWHKFQLEQIGENCLALIREK